MKPFGKISVLLVVVLLTSCWQKDIEKQIVGRWLSSENQVWTFNSDHTFTVSDFAGSKLFNQGDAGAKLVKQAAGSVTVRWDFVESFKPEHLVLTIIAISSSGSEYRVRINGIFELTDDNNARYGINGYDASFPDSFESALGIVTLKRQQ